MDTVFIHHLQTEAVIGIFPKEKLAAQPLIISVELGTDFDLAAETDDIAYALDYDKISCRIDEFVKNARVELLETLANKLISMLFSEFAIKRISLEITKPKAITLTQSVGIKIERIRDAQT